MSAPPSRVTATAWCSSFVCWLPNSASVPLKQFVQAERKICAGCQKQRPSGSREDRCIEGSLYSQSHRHRQCKDNQKDSTQQSSDASLPTENKEKTEDSFSSRGDKRQRRDHYRRQKPIEFGRIVHE